jgi:F-type H+-transporting ATPase subunit epsilon
MALPTKLTLHIVSPDASISQEVDEVSMPGIEGDFGVLPGHTPFFTTLRPGTMWYRVGAEKHVLMVAMGFVEVLPDSVSVLAQVAERAEDVLGVGPHEIDFERARLAMLRTLQQMQAESRKFQ